MAILGKSGDRLTREEDHEVLWIEAWGPDALRVRATKGPAMPDEDWALIRRPARARIEITARPSAISMRARAGRGMRAQSSPGIAGPLVARTRSASGPQASIQRIS